MKTNYLIILLICIVSISGSYFGIKDLLQSQKERKQWSAEERSMMVKKCIEECGTNALQYPKATQTYCECGHDKLAAQLSKPEYIALLQKSRDEIISTVTPLMQDCLTNYNKDMQQEMGNVRPKPAATWEELNQAFTSKYQTTIDIEDVQLAIDLLAKEKLIDTTLNISHEALPGFCYLSPSVMLDSYSKDSKLMRQPDNHKILTAEDEMFMLDQYQLRNRKEFKWQWVIKKTDTLNTFPRHEISLPVFSVDKTKFIIRVEKYTSEDCMVSGVAYLFTTEKQKTTHIIFDKVEGCQ